VQALFVQKMKLHNLVFYLLLLLFNYSDLRAQNLWDSSYARAVNVYDNTIGINSHLFNGSEYADYDHRTTGTPFFKQNSFSEGSIVYDDIQYTQIQMIYDIVRDEIAIKKEGYLPLLLVKQKIAAFDLAGHHFIKITTDSLTTGLKISGFYDVLYNGNTKLFAKRNKEIEEEIKFQERESAFIEKDEYYILNDGVFYTVNDKRSVLNALKDRKADVAKYLKQQKIKFKKNTENAMMKTIVYYNGLNNIK